jgi:hypothetical protein
MKSKTPKFIALALAIAVLASALPFAGPASAVPGDAKNLRDGHWTNQHRWIAFGRFDGKPIIWRILETGKTDDGKPMAFLLAEDAVAKMCFNESRSDGNDWDSSVIKRWLNNDFLSTVFSEGEKNAIVNCTYYYGGEHEGSGKKATSKVFLLSKNDAENIRFFANNTDRRINEYEREGDWWLRSPGDLDDNAALVVSGGGVHGFGSPVDSRFAVRPALKINLSSSIFTSSSSKYEILYTLSR